MLAPTQDNEQVIERIAALDIGKAELSCCIRVPDPKGSGKRLQEVATYTTMTRSLLGMADRLRQLGVTRVIFGVSGRDMMAALIGGQRDPKALAQLARGRMRAKISDLREAFRSVQRPPRVPADQDAGPDRRDQHRHHRRRSQDRRAGHPFR